MSVQPLDIVCIIGFFAGILLARRQAGQYQGRDQAADRVRRSLAIVREQALRRGGVLLGAALLLGWLSYGRVLTAIPLALIWLLAGYWALRLPHRRWTELREQDNSPLELTGLLRMFRYYMLANAALATMAMLTLLQELARRR